MYCSNCGRQVSDGANFCKKCGRPIGENEDKINSSLIPKNTSNEWKLSSFGDRLAAFIIDYVILVLICGGLIILLIGLIYGDQFTTFESGSWTDRLLSIGALIVFSMIFLGLFSNTPGKALYGLKIVDKKTHQGIDWKQIILRSFGYLFSGILFGYGFWKAGFNKERLTWHDELAGTIVLQRKTKLRYIGIILTIVCFIALLFVIVTSTNLEG